MSMFLVYVFFIKGWYALPQGCLPISTTGGNANILAAALVAEAHQPSWMITAANT